MHDRFLFFFVLSLMFVTGLSLWVVPASAAAAATYYVATNGNDSNSGTQSQPFRTIQWAADIVNPGDTVIVKNGLYQRPAAEDWAVVTLRRVGSADNWITFNAENKCGSVIGDEGPNSRNGFFFLANANYIRNEDFEMRGGGTGIDI